ncbi:MAG: universal stress protein [Alphaproteobacteria bacterium]|nr:universal stress protein [Alphaproteobacteria bacterium]MBL6936984.1 universal stress protein [Alphaproteobacteria bacterium]MBL7097753.1 universal stress protein [Alphaproteobacteria bacterium]
MTIRSILASLNGAESDAAVLETSAYAQKMLGAWVDCFHVTYDLAADQMLLAYAVGPGRSLPNERLRALDAEMREKSVRARQAFDDFCSRNHLAPVSALGVHGHFSYREVAGIEPNETIREARYRDLTITAREAVDDSFSIEKLGSIVMGSGRPVLIASQNAAASFGQKVVIAWKDTAEAARAVMAAMPILVHAKSITIATTNEEESQCASTEGSMNALAVQLRRHGFEVQARILPFTVRSAADRLLDYAYAAEADLLVMGGYGHGRFREYCLGGVTREVLADCAIPVLMTH